MSSTRNPKPEGLARPEKPSTVTDKVEAEVAAARALAQAAEVAGRPRLYLVTVHERAGSRAPFVLALTHEPTLQELLDELVARQAEVSPPWAVPFPERVRALLAEAGRTGGGAAWALGRMFARLETRAETPEPEIADQVTAERWPEIEYHHEGMVLSCQLHVGGPR